MVSAIRGKCQPKCKIKVSWSASWFGFSKVEEIKCRFKVVST